MSELKRRLLLLRKTNSRQGRLLRVGSPSAHTSSRSQSTLQPRTPETLEGRLMFSAEPLQFGSVYIEQDEGSDQSADTIEISFVGGAADTTLTRVEIDGDKVIPGLGPGFGFGDMVFDTLEGGYGIDLPFFQAIVRQEGEFDAQISVEDGSSLLTIEFSGFDAGEKLVLSIDVDEVQNFDPDETDLQRINDDLDPIASGAEFQGSRLTGYFSAPHYHDAQATAEFRNRYDDSLNATALNLPRDDENANRARTAGAVGELVQAPLPISISGRVYEDDNVNLQQDAGEEGLPDVALSLFVAENDGYVFTGHTTLTDANGDYTFGESLELPPGTYEVRETQPEGYFSVGAEVGEVDGVATGHADGDDTLTAIAIPLGGTQAVHYNFAEARPASLQGRVHLSTPEGDCWTDGIEHEPVVGAVIQLFDAQDQLVTETTTDSTGHYEFLNLYPGEYSIVEITPAHLLDGGAQAGTIDGITRGVAGDSNITQILLASGDEGIEYEFCDLLPAELRGNVYHDRNNDGLRDVGEEGIAGAILSLLDEEGLIVDTTETDDQGRYEFVGVRAGNYRVMELQPAGWLDGKDRAGTASGRPTGRALNPGDEIEAIQLLWGDRATDYDFGELKPAAISGNVHLSTPDGDCWDIDEGILEPVAGAVVQLFDATGQVLAETVTDENGNYFFDDLIPGEYAIREITPEGLLDGGARAGQIDGESRGQVSELGDIQDIRLDSGQSGFNYDFCEYMPASISGYVYHDASNDGIRDAGEDPIAGVVMQLLDEDGNVVAETVTNANGQYTFDGILAGRYAIRQIHPQGYLDGLDAAGTFGGEQRGVAQNPGDEIQSIQIGWGEVGIEYNFAELLPATLTGFVRSSPNENCWEEEDAVPLAGIRVMLFDETERMIAETLTDTRGVYAFDALPPGSYRVVQEQPRTHFDGSHRAGNAGGDATVANQIRDIELHSGEAAWDYDFCELPPASISGFVFVDGAPIELQPEEVLPVDISPIRSGELSEDDQRLAGVRLELRDGTNGVAIDASIALPDAYPEGPIQTTTDEDGYYEFPNLPRGNYAVYQLQPEGYVDGIDTPGTADGIAINPLPPDVEDIELETVIASLVHPPHNDAIVKIGLFAGTHSSANNFSEVTTTILERPPVVPPVVPPLPPVPPTPLQPPIAPAFPSLYQFARELPPRPVVEDRIPNDGSDSTERRTWHLSIVDGGQPRVSVATARTSYSFPASVWHQQRFAAAKWQIETEDGQPQVHFFGALDGIPITGDFDGDGVSEIGVYVDGHWFIDLNGNGHWDSTDLWAKLGTDGDLPVTGDWDGDGKDDIGIFGRIWVGDMTAIAYEHGLPDLDNIPDGTRKNMPPKLDRATSGQRLLKLTARGDLRADLIDHVFLYGAAGDMAVAGDWNGDGIDTVGVYRAGVWRLDTDGNGRWTETDEAVRFGRKGDFPLVGDFNGDGIDDLAIVRGGKIYFDTNGNRKIDVNDLVMEYDESKGLPVVGTWSENGVDSIGYFKPIEERRITVAAQTDSG